MYLGIDLGTSSVKLTLIDDTQQATASASADLQVSRPQALWSEQNPLDWWHAVEAAFFQLKLHMGDHVQAIKAIGLSGQMHGAVILDAKGQLIRPAILWNDGRAFAECEELLAKLPDAHTITGNLIMPGFTAPKLLWLAKHEPDNFKRIHKVLLPKDYLRYCLSGDFATDCSDAAGTCWLDVEKRQWSSAMIEASQLTEQHMPNLYEGNQVTGQLLPRVAKHWGLSENVSIVAGGGDNAASAISIDVTEPGCGFISLGTSGVYFIADDQYRPNPDSAVHTFCHCLPARWHQMNVHLSAASCVTWLAQLVDGDAVELITQASQHESASAPLFLPYLSGERTPHNNPHARGVFLGLDYDCTAVTLMQAVLEGVSLAFADGQRLFEQQGIVVNNLSLVGGGARSDYWAQMIADALDRPIDVLDSAELGGALGAAKLAWLADTGSPCQQLNKPHVQQQYQPNPSRVDYFKNRLKRFRQLGANLELTHFHEE